MLLSKIIYLVTVGNMVLTALSIFIFNYVYKGMEEIEECIATLKGDAMVFVEARKAIEAELSSMKSKINDMRVHNANNTSRILELEQAREPKKKKPSGE